MKQPGQFALGESWHPAILEYDPLLAEAVRATGMTRKKDPSRLPCYRITFVNTGSCGATPNSETHGDNRRYPLLHGCIGNAIIAQWAIQQYFRSMPNRPSK